MSKTTFPIPEGQPVVTDTHPAAERPAASVMNFRAIAGETGLSYQQIHVLLDQLDVEIDVVGGQYCVRRRDYEPIRQELIDLATRFRRRRPVRGLRYSGVN